VDLTLEVSKELFAEDRDVWRGLEAEADMVAADTDDCDTDLIRDDDRLVQFAAQDQHGS
jgi:hypothetical protein